MQQPFWRFAIAQALHSWRSLVEPNYAEPRARPPPVPNTYTIVNCAGVFRSCFGVLA
jgi:hypothetical protein